MPHFQSIVFINLNIYGDFQICISVPLINSLKFTLILESKFGEILLPVIYFYSLVQTLRQLKKLSPNISGLYLVKILGLIPRFSIYY